MNQKHFELVPDRKIGECVIYKGERCFVKSITAASTTDRYVFEYGLTRDMPAPYHYGQNIFAAEVDADELVSVSDFENVVIERDGNAWCAHRKDFINLQESSAGFGADTNSAIYDLIKNERDERKA